MLGRPGARQLLEPGERRLGLDALLRRCAVARAHGPQTAQDARSRTRRPPSRSPATDWPLITIPLFVRVSPDTMKNKSDRQGRTGPSTSHCRRPCERYYYFVHLSSRTAERRNPWQDWTWPSNTGRSRRRRGRTSRRRSPRPRSQYGRWIHRVEWSPDRTAVSVAGTGFDVRLSYDERKVYARGTIPMAVKLLEGPITAFVARALKK